MSKSYRVLAINFYDGPTEGFQVHLDGKSSSYFHLLAWDEDQDQRLFVIADIEFSDLSRLEDLLRAAGQTPERQTWIPEWKFEKSSDAAKANEILDRCRRGLASGSLVLGHEPRTSEVLSPVTAALQRDVAEAVKRRTPDDLKLWKERLSMASDS